MNLRAPIKKTNKLDYEELRSRRGIFRLSMDLIKDQPKYVMKIMSKCIVTKCECRYLNDDMEYHAMSPYFTPCAEGAMSPTYIFDQDGKPCK